MTSWLFLSRPGCSLRPGCSFCCKKRRTMKRKGGPIQSTQRDDQGKAPSYTHCVYNATAAGCRSHSRALGFWRTYKSHVPHVGNTERSNITHETIARIPDKISIPDAARHCQAREQLGFHWLGPVWTSRHSKCLISATVFSGTASIFRLNSACTTRAWHLPRRRTSRRCPFRKCTRTSRSAPRCSSCRRCCSPT